MIAIQNENLGGDSPRSPRHGSRDKLGAGGDSARSTIASFSPEQKMLGIIPSLGFCGLTDSLQRGVFSLKSPDDVARARVPEFVSHRHRDVCSKCADPTHAS